MDSLIFSLFHLVMNHCFSCLIQENSENKPRGLYFSKALFEGPIFEGAYIRRGLCVEGNLRFKIDWASLIVGWKFTVFALFCYVFEGNFQVQAPRRLIYIKGRFNEGFFCVTSLRGLYLEGLIHGGAYFGNSTGYYIQNEGSAIAAC